MSDEQCQMILNVRKSQSCINIGRLVKIIALCNNLDGIQTILDAINNYRDEYVRFLNSY